MDQSDDRGWSSLPVLWFGGEKPRSASQLLDADCSRKAPTRVGVEPPRTQRSEKGEFVIFDF
jgi:hypothetical protein